MRRILSKYGALYVVTKDVYFVVGEVFFEPMLRSNEKLLVLIDLNTLRDHKRNVNNGVGCQEFIGG